VALMSKAAVAETLTIAAVPEQVRLARAFVIGALGRSHPRAFDAALLASEMVTNSVRHSGSAVQGGFVTVAVTVGEGGVRVEVTDRGGDSVPVLKAVGSADGDGEGGKGMRLVDALAARWGYERGGGYATTWFEIEALLQPMQHSAVSGKGLNSPDVDASGS
jgi:anti-sigma regulatory factor (Ser/Thr protein kinase)